RVLFGLQQGLLSLSGQIGYSSLPLAQAMTAAAAAAGTAAPIFAATAEELAHPQGRTAGEIWQDRLALADAVLTEADQEVLLSLGAELGLTGREEQLQRLELVRLRLAELEQEAKEAKNDFGKLWKSLGVGVGVITILLFL
ncbi:MAG: stage III sporulation protein AB, partial [Clostridiales bacterium]